MHRSCRHPSRPQIRHHCACICKIVGIGYPYNKAVAFWEADRLLRAKQENVLIVECRDAVGSLVLHGDETYYTGNTLYYIHRTAIQAAARPKDKTGSRTALYLSYLYHVAGIPHYTDESSYLCWQYDMIREWVENAPDGLGTGKLQQQLLTAYQGKQKMMWRIDVWRGT